MLPSADGASLIARLRSTPGLQVIPAIAVTGYPDPRRALDAGFDAVLIKPVEPKQLCAAIEQALSQPREAAYRDAA